jgi:hypothetical protein
MTRVADGGGGLNAIRGDPWALRQLASRLADLAGEVEDAGHQVAAINAARWTGPAARAFKQVAHQQPRRYAAAAEAIAGAAEVISGYAAALEEAQGLMARASVMGASGGALDAMEAATVGALADEQLCQAAIAAVSALHAAAAGAPTKPSLWSGVVHTAFEVARAGPVNFTIGVGKGTWSALDGFYQTGSLLARGTDPLFVLLDPSAAEAADEKLAGVARAVARDPVAFLESAGKGVIDWNEWSRNPGQALGALIPGIAAAFGTDGAGEAGDAGAVAANAARHALLVEQLRVADAANRLVESLSRTGSLPPEYVTKLDAARAGWAPGKAPGRYIPGGQIGGDLFHDPGSIGLPTESGQTWYEADVGLNNLMSRSSQGGWRLLYSDHGEAFVTSNHYQDLYRLPGW